MNYFERVTNPLGTMFTDKQIARFWSHVEKTDTCWIWTGGKDGKGYGRMRLPGSKDKWTSAHRFAWTITRGAVGPGLVIDHKREVCHSRACANPDHLEPVTQAVNLARAENSPASRTHCPRNHEYTEENTYINPSGKRVCKACWWPGGVMWEETRQKRNAYQKEWRKQNPR